LPVVDSWRKSRSAKGGLLGHVGAESPRGIAGDGSDAGGAGIRLARIRAIAALGTPAALAVRFIVVAAGS